MLGAYTTLAGNPNGNKDTVVEGVQWELTGNQNTDWMAPGASAATNGADGSNSSGSASSSSSPSQPSGGGSSPTTFVTATKTAAGQGQQTSRASHGGTCRKRQSR